MERGIDTRKHRLHLARWVWSVTQCVWQLVKPERRDISYLLLGFLLGLLSTCYFEWRSVHDHKIAVLRGTISEVAINMNPSWYPMYFDSSGYDKAGFTYPVLNDDALRGLSRELWLFLEDVSTDAERLRFISMLAETAGIIGEFNERVRLRNTSIVCNTFSSGQSGHAYNFYQRQVRPKLVECKNLLECTLNELDP
jgi:hypothetical protein